MTRSQILGTQCHIGGIFSDSYRFEIPPYQRPYSWTTDEAGELFDDLLAAATRTDDIEEADPYFLGSIVLIKEEDKALSQVVDGQQRLTTITLLLAALMHCLDSQLSKELRAMLYQEGSRLAGREDQPRLQLRQRDRDFFNEYVLSGDLERILNLDTSRLTDSQLNLAGNARLFVNRLRAMKAGEMEGLAIFVHRKTFLVVVSTPEFDSAYRIFTVLNERGLDLSHSDVFKAAVLGQVPQVQVEMYTKKWEDEEEDLGRQDFADLFPHIRMIYAKTKARESILKEFRSAVLDKYSDGRRFIDEVLVPYSDAYEVIKNCACATAPAAARVNHLLKWLNLLDNKDWVSPALTFLRQSTSDSTLLARRLTALDNLASSLFIRRVDVTRRLERYGRVLSFLESDSDPLAPGSPLLLEGSEQRETLDCLNGDIYLSPKTRLYVLLRLEAVLSDAGSYMNYPTISVEHVLPQNPSEGSDWRSNFSEEEHRKWLHKLGNLVLLSRRKNSEASNYNFADKKERYFSIRTGGSPFTLTSTVLKRTSWTPEVIAARQEEFIAHLARLWDLKK